MHFDDIEVKDCLAAEKALRDFVKTKHAALVDRIESTKDLSKDDEAELHDRDRRVQEVGTY